MIKTFDSYINEMNKSTIPDECKNGDCYQVGYRYFNKNAIKNPNLRLVHGLVTGQGKINGIVYNHCWCEDIKEDMVIDMTMPSAFQMVPRVVYYALGKIDEETVYKYDHSQVMAKSVEYGTYGPWEEKLLANEF